MLKPEEYYVHWQVVQLEGRKAMRIGVVLTKTGPQVVLVRDPQIITVCPGCFQPICEGDKVYTFGKGVITHNNTDCVMKYIEPEETTIEEAML